MLFNLATRGILRRKLQSIMMVFGFVFAVALFVALTTLIKSARISFSRPFPPGVDMIVQLEGEPCVWAPVKLPTVLNPIPSSAVDGMRRLIYVQDASGILITWVFSEMEAGEAVAKLDSSRLITEQTPTPDRLVLSEALRPLVITGIDSSHLNLGPIRSADIIKGRFFEPGSREEVVLDAEFAKLIDKNIGETVKLGNREFKVVGIAYLHKDAGFRAQGYVDLSVAQTMLGRGEVVDSIFVKLHPGVMSLQLLDKEIRRLVGKSANIVTTRDYSLMFEQVSQAERIYLTTFFLITIIISALFIFKSILSYIGQKIRDIGILKAIGWNQRTIVQLIVYENTLLATAGGISGSILGYILVAFHKVRNLQLPYFLNPIPPCNITGSEISIAFFPKPSIYIFLYGIIIAVVLGVILGYLIGLKISRVDSASALRSI